MRCLISSDLVAAKLSRSKTWFLKNKTRLMTENGFPKPIAAVGDVWDEIAIDRWIDAYNDNAFSFRTVDEAERERVKSDISDRIRQVFPNFKQ